MFRIATVVLVLVTFCIALPPAEAAQKDRHRAQQHSPLKVLPKGYHKVIYKGTPYFYSAGRFYRHGNGSYAAITAPIGAVVPALPGGYVTFAIGANSYFYFQGTYYRHINSGYEVVEEPVRAQEVLTRGSDKLIAYPALGQTNEQSDRDRYECHAWASDETHFDPSDESSDPLLRADYNRALGACLEARNYVVK